MKQSSKTPLRLKSIYLFISVTLVILAVANIVASNTLATTGKTLQQLRQQAVTLELENQLLQQKISQTSSLSAISQLASDQGFIPISQTLTLTTPEPLAQAP